MRSSTAAPHARRPPGTGLPFLVASGLLWGTGATAACRAVWPADPAGGGRQPATVGGVAILALLAATGRQPPAGGPPGPASW